MVELTQLWLPILLSAVVIFTASSVLHMATPWHFRDYKKLPEEEALRRALRDAGVTRGEYMVPGCDRMDEWRDEALQNRYKEGPVATLVVQPDGMPNMGASMLAWILYTLLVGAIVGYLATLAPIPAGAEYARVFRFTGTAAVLAYALNTVTNSIWKGVSWKTTGKFIVDGTLYGLLTGGTFGWLWPGA